MISVRSIFEFKQSEYTQNELQRNEDKFQKIEQEKQTLQDKLEKEKEREQLQKENEKKRKKLMSNKL